MKRELSLLLLTAFMLALAACTTDRPSSAGPSTSPRTIVDVAPHSRRAPDIEVDIAPHLVARHLVALRAGDCERSLENYYFSDGQQRADSVAACNAAPAVDAFHLETPAPETESDVLALDPEAVTVPFVYEVDGRSQRANLSVLYRDGAYWLYDA